MSEKKTDNSKWNLDAALRHIYIDEIIFIAMVFLCFLGEVIIEVFERGGIFYWLLMTPVFGFFSVISEKTKVLATGHSIKNASRYLFFYWGSAFLTVLLVFLAWHGEIIKAGAVAMVIHIILAHTLFLSGMVLGFRFYLIGLLLFGTAALTILMQTSFGIDLLFAIPFLWFGFYWEKHRLFPTLKRKNDFVREMVEGEEYGRRAEDKK